MNSYESKAPKLHEYKNALHFGCVANSKPIQDSSEDKKTLSWKRPFCHPKERNQTNSGNSSRETLQRVGITIDDAGHLLLAEWSNNKMQGMYFLFKPNIVEEVDQNMACFGICQYGYIRQGLLQDDNYMYNVSGSLIKGTFLHNKLIEQCYIAHNNKAFVSQNSKDQQMAVQCEVINFYKNQKTNVTSQNAQNPVKSQIPQFQSFSPFQNKERQHSKSFNCEMIDATLFIKPIQFLERMVAAYDKAQQQQTIKNTCLSKLKINEHQNFCGFLQQPKETAVNKSTCSPGDLNGFGVLFRDGWPFKYGRFQRGNLEGLGRIYETQMTICDGFFTHNKMSSGFIIDYYNNQLSFGHTSPSHSSSHQQQFIVTKTYSCAQLQVIFEFKKQHHLKSLGFKNNYFTSPRLFFHSPWPLSLISKLYQQTQINNIIKNFNPAIKEFDISEIQKEGQSSDNRVERLIVNEMQNQKTKQEQQRAHKLNVAKGHIIDLQITNYIKKKDASFSHENPQAIDRYLKEYQDIVNSHPKKNNSSDKNRRGQAQSQRYSNKPYLQTDRTPTGHNQQLSYASPQQVRKPQPQAIGSTYMSRNIPNPNSLTDLIREYHICETERQNIIFYCTPRNNTARRSAPRNVASKGNLMSKDHFEQRLNATERRIPSRSRSTRRTEIDLHRIYEKYLKS